MTADRWLPAYVGLGSNLDEPVAQVRRALAALDGLPQTRLVARSSLYRSPPLGPPDQPDYVNAVAGLLTGLPAAELLAALQGIEDAQGRRRDGPRWGPRTLDLDLLLYGELAMHSDTLVLPHPGLAERTFVLVPLLEVAPGLRVAGGSRVAQLATQVGDGGLVRMEG
jgi:2-amino-4-hydroxy-6-hydroxymethyldihydropteridine diphosphokinase